MEYDEAKFKRSANKKALSLWLIINLILVVAYALEVKKGIRTIEYYCTFMAFAWVPFLIGVVVLKIKGMAFAWYKEIIAIGFGVFYLYVVYTTINPLAFAFIFPLSSLLIIYKDRAMIIRCGGWNILAMILVVVRDLSSGLTLADKMTDYEIMVACIVLTYVSFAMAINHLNLSVSKLKLSI